MSLNSSVNNKTVNSNVNYVPEQLKLTNPMGPIPFQLNSLATEALEKKNLSTPSSTPILINTPRTKTKTASNEQSVKFHDASPENFLLNEPSPTHNITNIGNAVRQGSGGNPYDSDPDPSTTTSTSTNVTPIKPSGNNPYDPDPDETSSPSKDPNSTGLTPIYNNNPYDPESKVIKANKTDFKETATAALKIGATVGVNVIAGNFIDKGYELAEKASDTVYKVGEFAIGINNLNDFKDSWDLKIYERKNKNGVIKNIERDATLLEKGCEAAGNLIIGASKVVGWTAITHGGISQMLGSTGGISGVTQTMFNGAWGVLSTAGSVGWTVGKAVVPTIVNAGSGLVSGAINDPVEATVGLATANLTYGAVKCFKAASKTDSMLSKIGYGLAGTAQAVGAVYGAIWVLKI